MQYVTFRAILPNGNGLVTLEIYHEDDERLICGIHRIEGHLRLLPKAWLRTIWAELEKIETIARDAGCVEMRVAGRNWLRILAPCGYEPMPGIENRLRKAL